MFNNRAFSTVCLWFWLTGAIKWSFLALLGTLIGCILNILPWPLNIRLINYEKTIKNKLDIRSSMWQKCHNCQLMSQPMGQIRFRSNLSKNQNYLVFSTFDQFLIILNRNRGCFPIRCWLDTYTTLVPISKCQTYCQPITRRLENIILVSRLSFFAFGNPEFEEYGILKVMYSMR